MMKVQGFNGKTYNLDLRPYIIPPNDSKKRSIPHVKVKSLLIDLFRGNQLFEEVKLPGSRPAHKQSVLFLDFLIPTFNLAVEVHGRQHYEFVPFYHKITANFYEGQYRDRLKADWCELNKMRLVVLNADDKIEKWDEQIRIACAS